jgi:4-amino-4-deoxy-L-arabinose transferase-like glycosyltransferase
MGKRGVAFTGLLLVVALLRLRLLDFPLTRDEGDYAYMAQLWLDGVPPYTAAYDMRMPGIFAVYALILSVFGQSAWGIHMGLLIVHLASVWIVFELGRELVDSTAGFAAAVCFAAFGLNPWINGAVANTEHFVLLPVLGGLLVLLRGLRSGRHAALGAAGVLMGFAAVTKQNAALLAVFAALVVAWRTPTRLPAFLIASVIPLAAACGLLAASGSFESFWFWTVTYPGEYSTALAPEAAWFNFSRNLPLVVGWTLGFWLLAALGASALLQRARAGFARVFLLGFLLFSFLALTPGFHFRYKHFQMLIPAISLLAGVAVSALAGWALAHRGRGVARATAAALVALPLVAFVTGEREVFQMDAIAPVGCQLNCFRIPRDRRFISENGRENVRSRSSAPSPRSTSTPAAARPRRSSSSTRR